MNQDKTGITKLGCVNHDCGHCQPKREWVGLTDDERIALIVPNQSQFVLMKNTEAKLKEKNT